MRVVRVPLESARITKVAMRRGGARCMSVREQPSPEIQAVRFPREQRRAAHPDIVAVERFLRRRFPVGSPSSRNPDPEADRCGAAARRLLSRDERRTPMKHITRLALAFAVAALACVSPMALADDATLGGSGEPGVNPVRYYQYADEDDKGAMLVQDGPAHPKGKWITVTIYQGNYAYTGQGWRSLASEETNWFAYCEFRVYGNGLSAKFTGYIPLKVVTSGALPGKYFVNGSGAPHAWYAALN